MISNSEKSRPKILRLRLIKLELKLRPNLQRRSFGTSRTISDI
jgi:hypothetical protein